MATHINPDHGHRELSVFAQGVVGIQPFRFDLEADYATGAAAAGSLIQIGVVPVDCVLVPQLSLLDLPELDTDSVPTGDYEIGTADDPDALKVSTAAEAAIVMFGEDWLRPSKPVGSRTQPTPIYIKIVNVLEELGTGVIAFDLAFRAWNTDIDG